MSTHTHEILSACQDAPDGHHKFWTFTIVSYGETQTCCRYCGRAYGDSRPWKPQRCGGSGYPVSNLEPNTKGQRQCPTCGKWVPVGARINGLSGTHGLRAHKAVA